MPSTVCMAFLMGSWFCLRLLSCAYASRQNNNQSVNSSFIYNVVACNSVINKSTNCINTDE